MYVNLTSIYLEIKNPSIINKSNAFVMQRLSIGILHGILGRYFNVFVLAAVADCGGEVWILLYLVWIGDKYNWLYLILKIKYTIYVFYYKFEKITNKLCYKV